MDRYGVIGNPVEHSKSPQIHTAFARQTGEQLDYSKITCEPDAFNDCVRAFRDAGGKGLNVTLPFKQQAFELADDISGRARLAGAVNTLTFSEDGEIHADNTDGAGLTNDLKRNLGLELRNMDILILGAGGAVRGVLGPLLAEHPRHIVIANRTLEKAILLADQFSNIGQIQGCDYQELGTQAFDLVINGTSMGLTGGMPELPENLLKSNATVYDMAYGDDATVFQTWGETRGARLSANGLGMLVEQAAESFYLWRGIRPQTGPVLATLASTTS